MTSRTSAIGELLAHGCRELRRAEHERPSRRDLVPDDAVALDGCAGGPDLELGQVRDVGDADVIAAAPPRREPTRARAIRRAPRTSLPRRAAAARAPTSRPGGSLLVGCGSHGQEVEDAHAFSLAPSGSKNGAQVHGHRDGLPVDLHVEAAAVDGEVERNDREPDHLVELGCCAHARDAPGRDCRRRRPGRPRRESPGRALEADEHPPEPALGDLLGRPLADEVRLVGLHDPRHRRLEQVRLGVGVLAHDHVPLLEAEDPLGLETERRGPEIGAALEQRVPHVLGVRARQVQLVAELADESDPQPEGGDARDRS